MKKVIVLTLCMLLLLSGCGYLGGAEGALIQMRDLVVSDSDVTVDMSGLTAGVELACRDDVCGLRMTVSAGDELANEFIVALVDDSVLFLFNGGTGEPLSYVVNDPEVVGPIREVFDTVMAAGGELGDGDTSLEDMTDEELEAYMAGLEEQLEGMVPGSGIDAAQAARLAEILEQCVSEGEPQQFEGETYNTTNIDLPHDELMELLDMVDTSEYTEQDESLADLLEEAGVTLDLTGVIAVSEDGEKNAYGFTPVLTSDDGEQVTMNITLQQTKEDGSLDLYFDIGDDSQLVGSLSLNLNAEVVETADWLPEEVSADAQPVDFDDEASADAFNDGLTDFLGQVLGTIAGMTAGNGAVDALD